MFFVYVDESGDPGLQNSLSDYFILAALIVHESQWQQTLDKLIAFRRGLKQKYSLNVREEIHASHLINKPGHLSAIPKHERLAILRDYVDMFNEITDLNIFAIVVGKSTKHAPYDVFDEAWGALIQRCENTLTYGNFRGAPYSYGKQAKDAPRSEHGLIIPDATDSIKLKTLVRKMRYQNYVPNNALYANNPPRNLPIKLILEDPFMKDSADSYFTQSADVIAYLLLQKLKPNKYMKSKSANNYFNRLKKPLVREVSNTKDGLVFL